MVKVSYGPRPWIFSAIYASPDPTSRLFLWDNLDHLAQTHTGEWLMSGDFNKILTASEKLGGNNANLTRIALFRDCLNTCNMIDLGYRGNKFTWSNKRYRNRSSLILERLDSCLTNNSWINHYPDATVTHLRRTKSDHCPLILSLNNKTPTGPKPFRMEPMWCSHPTFKPLIDHCFNTSDALNLAVKSFQVQAKIWNSHVFGNIFKRMGRINVRLDGL